MSAPQPRLEDLPERYEDLPPGPLRQGQPTLGEWRRRQRYVDDDPMVLMMKARLWASLILLGLVAVVLVLMQLLGWGRP
jgi:hypothetical protein